MLRCSAKMANQRPRAERKNATSYGEYSSGLGVGRQLSIRSMSLREGLNERVASMRQVISSTVASKLDEPSDRLKWYLFVMIVLWLTTGTIFLHYAQGWSILGSLFYAVNVGLGVGYGDFTVTNKGSMIFVVFFCMIGSSFMLPRARWSCNRYWSARSI